MKQSYKINKNRVLLFTAILLSSFMNAQSISELDKRNGFKDFKIGDSLDKWSSSAKFLGNNNGISSYLYTGYCCNKVFDQEVESIELIFNNAKKLVAIGIRLKSFRKSNGKTYVYFDPDLEDYKNLRNKFSALFGREKENLSQKPSSKSPIATSLWNGNSISLELNYWYTGITGEDWCVIFVSDNGFSNKSLQSGF
tara:strand:- start:903 stop:1490 length:588 start_codon:yes stop_codon:yes gene_type:complete